MGRLYDDEDYETESLLKEISDSLGRQISDELRKENTSYNRNIQNRDIYNRDIQNNRNIERNRTIQREQTSSSMRGTAYTAGSTATGSSDVAGSTIKVTKKSQSDNKKKIFVTLGAVIVSLLLVVVLVGNYVLDQLNYEDGSIILDEEGNEIVVEDFVPSNKEVINILLIGEEAMADDRGRSDVMMVMTINQEHNRLTLTSFLRDSYVIPSGYSNGCKMNEVYKKGGGPLLVSTIEEQFQIQIDGYARVNFQSFEEIIDLLGGVDIELTAEEAEYLNRTNYISDKANRNVVPGMQTLNGNQALGYSRVRYVKGINGERDDFGRTNRQRTVINAIFNKYKSKNLVDLVAVTNKILPCVTTDMTKSEILSYLSVAAGMLGSAELETFRVPMNDAYSGEKINGKSVLVVDFAKVREALQDEIYGTGYLTEKELKELEGLEDDAVVEEVAEAENTENHHNKKRNDGKGKRYFGKNKRRNNNSSEN